jgi:hypothetical protein
MLRVVGRATQFTLGLEWIAPGQAFFALTAYNEAGGEMRRLE